MKEPFRAAVEDIQRRARMSMQRGAVTDAYRGDARQVVQVLNEVLATEIVCTLRYKSHYYRVDGPLSEAIAQEFLEHAAEEQAHADLVARRIVQLGGTPDLNPETLMARSHAPFDQAATITEMIQEDLVAERIAIETYAEIVRWLGDDDPTSRRMMEELLAKEEEHAEELASLLRHTS
jgi:bacterioferritin